MRANFTLKALLLHARRHWLASTALVFSLLSLVGASYAAFEIPDGAVGARQIKNRVITPVKFAPSVIGGSVRHWALVDAMAKVVEASSHAVARLAGNTITIDWGDKFPGRCVPLVTIRGNGDVAIGSIEASILHGGTPPTRVIVTGADAQGQPAAQPFYVAVIC